MSSRPPDKRRPAPPRQLFVVVALGIVYVVWGSTYLAIRVVVQDLPPLASASWRFLCAGLLLGGGIAVFRGWQRLRITWRELLGCSAVGLMLPALGNGLVVVAEHRGAPSGVAALLGTGRMPARSPACCSASPVSSA
jgi:drug/metabolite transporter (DMT)-like permease